MVFSRTGLETAGVLAGRKDVDGDVTTFSVERAFPVTALRTDELVGHSCRSPELLDELAAALHAPFEVVGGFHSHPLREVGITEIERDRRYLPSVGDLHNPVPFWGHDIDLIVSVANAGTSGPKPLHAPGPTVQTRVGEFEFWIHAHRGSDPVQLEIETEFRSTEPAISNWQRQPPPPF